MCVPYSGLRPRCGEAHARCVPQRCDRQVDATAFRGQRSKGFFVSSSCVAAFDSCPSMAIVGLFIAVIEIIAPRITQVTRAEWSCSLHALETCDKVCRTRSERGGGDSQLYRESAIICLPTGASPAGVFRSRWVVSVVSSEW